MKRNSHPLLVPEGPLGLHVLTGVHLGGQAGGVGFASLLPKSKVVTCLVSFAKERFCQK